MYVWFILGSIILHSIFALHYVSCSGRSNNSLNPPKCAVSRVHKIFPEQQDSSHSFLKKKIQFQPECKIKWCVKSKIHKHVTQHDMLSLISKSVVFVRYLLYGIIKDRLNRTPKKDLVVHMGQWKNKPGGNLFLNTFVNGLANPCCSWPILNLKRHKQKHKIRERCILKIIWHVWRHHRGLTSEFYPWTKKFNLKIKGIDFCPQISVHRFCTHNVHRWT